MEIDETNCHSLKGLCGLKLKDKVPYDAWESHSLKGLCGLKSVAYYSFRDGTVVTA